MIWDQEEPSKPLSTVLVFIQSQMKIYQTELKPHPHLPHILPLESQEQMYNPFCPSFCTYLFITLTKAYRWEQLQSQHITIVTR